MKTVAFVPIRLNSKRVAGKNLKMLGDKPLLRYILDTLVKVKRIDEVYVAWHFNSILLAKDFNSSKEIYIFHFHNEIEHISTFATAKTSKKLTILLY